MRMSAPQRAYALAKAAYDLANHKYFDRCVLVPQPGPNATEAEWEAAADRCEKVSAELKLSALREALWAAEATLIDWGVEVVRKSVVYAANATDCETMFNHVGTNIASPHRRSFITETAKLDAGTIPKHRRPA